MADDREGGRAIQGSLNLPVRGGPVETAGEDFQEDNDSVSEKQRSSMRSWLLAAGEGEISPMQFLTTSERSGSRGRRVSVAGIESNAHKAWKIVEFIQLVKNTISDDDLYQDFIDTLCQCIMERGYNVMEKELRILFKSRPYLLIKLKGIDPDPRGLHAHISVLKDVFHDFFEVLRDLQHMGDTVNVEVVKLKSAIVYLDELVDGIEVNELVQAHCELCDPMVDKLADKFTRIIGALRNREIGNENLKSIEAAIKFLV